VKVGIFAKTFVRRTLAQVLDAVVSNGFETVQFNMACAGLESMPEEVPDEKVDAGRREVSARGLEMCALSATFNAIHPDRAERRKGVERFKVLASRAREMGTDLLTLCTGTRSTESQWTYHADNGTPEAYRDLLGTLAELVAVAEAHDLRLGIEPEIHNVIDSARKASRLLDDMRSPRLTVIMDPANLFRREDLPRMDDVLTEAFELLGGRIALAHAKDVSDEDPPVYGAAGTGCLDYVLYVKLLRDAGYDGPLVLHSLSEEQVPTSAAYVRSFLEV